MAKVDAARGYGATVELGGDGFDETVAVARTREAETGATFVHAFDDARVVAGQGTLGLELAGQLPSGGLTVVIPVGGGGLAAGIAIALRALRPRCGSWASSRQPARRSRGGSRSAPRSPTASPSSIPARSPGRSSTS